MNEKLLQKQRLPTGNGVQNGLQVANATDPNSKLKKLVKNVGDKKGNVGPISSLDWIGA